MDGRWIFVSTIKKKKNKNRKKSCKVKEYEAVKVNQNALFLPFFLACFVPFFPLYSSSPF